VYVVVYIERHVQPNQPRAEEGAQAARLPSGRRAQDAGGAPDALTRVRGRTQRFVAWKAEIPEGSPWRVVIERYRSYAEAVAAIADSDGYASVHGERIFGGEVAHGEAS